MTTTARAQTPVTLSWDPPSTGAPSAYVVQWGPAPGLYVASTVASGTTSHQVDGLEPGLRYYFTVVAVDAAGARSQPSNEVAVVGPLPSAGEVAPLVRDGLPRESLTVTAGGTGQGTIAVRPGPGECVSSCVAMLPRGTPVVLVATPSAGHRFAGWEGCGDDVAGTCLLRLDGAREVTARFEADGSSAVVHTRYLAEGATGDFFETRLALANPGGRATSARLRFQRDDGHALTHVVAVPALATVTVDTSIVPDLHGHAFSTVVDSELPLVVDRTMTWRGPDGLTRGAHAETSIATPASRWYLAEGATHAGFDLFYLLQNPQDTAVPTRITYLRAAGPPLVRELVLPPRSRTSIWVDQETFGADARRLLQASEVSALVETLGEEGIVVERAMYDSRNGVTFEAGHESAGVTAPARRWYFAEGATGAFFDQFLLVANPTDTPAEVTVTYLRPGAPRVVRHHRVAAMSRYTIWVDEDAPELRDTAVSSVVEASAPVVVERSMWWPGTSATWHEAHNTAGTTVTALRWAMADGNGGTAVDGRATYVLIANPTSELATVRVTLLFGDGIAPATRTVRVPAFSRFGLSVGDTFAEARGRSCGALVESVGLEPTPIIVERAMYADAPGQSWASGTTVLATPLP